MTFPTVLHSSCKLPRRVNRVGVLFTLRRSRNMDSPEYLPTQPIDTAPAISESNRMSEHNPLVPWKRSDACHRIDQRAYPRMPWIAVVDYVLLGCTFRDFILDIGPGGAFIQSCRPRPVGQEIQLVFSLFDHQVPDKLIGEVVWTCHEGIGVRFKSVPRCLV
jgi:hypothetical protein